MKLDFGCRWLLLACRRDPQEGVVRSDAGDIDGYLARLLAKFGLWQARRQGVPERLERRASASTSTGEPAVSG